MPNDFKRSIVRSLLKNGSLSLENDEELITRLTLQISAFAYFKMH